MSNTTEPIVPAVDRALNVLEYIAQARDCVSIKQIAADLRIPYTSVFRIVKQLVARGYLEEDNQRLGHFHLGFQILSLVNGMTYINDLRQIAHSELYNLALNSKQVVQMGVLRDFNVTYIEQILPPNPVILYTALYSVLPLNISAAGKVLAAFASPHEREYLIQNTVFDKSTPNTIGNRSDFIAELDTIRRVGYAEDNEEFSIGIGCLAAPIFNHEMHCVAAIGITGGIGDYKGKSKETLTRMLLQSSRSISRRLGMPRNELNFLA